MKFQTTYSAIVQGKHAQQKIQIKGKEDQVKMQ